MMRPYNTSLARESDPAAVDDLHVMAVSEDAYL
jgi:hypothetical protein